MKKIVFFFLLAALSVQAQYTIKGTMNPPGSYDWVILYKIEGAKQVFVQSGALKKDAKGNQFSFSLPTDSKTGMYRVTYKTEGKGFADFLFNKENIEFSFNPEKAEETISFTLSKENKLYQRYIKTVSKNQYKADSLQISFLKNPNEGLKTAYKNQLKKLATMQNDYLKKSKGMMVQSFVKATNRYNNPQLASKPQTYLNDVVTHFFDNINFNNKDLYNSTFLVDRITDYVFYMNYSDDPKIQKNLHKKAVTTVLNKATDPTFKKDVLEFLITQFANYNNVEFADELLNTSYKKLPTPSQNTNFIKNYYEKTQVAVGRVAPEITWSENGKNYKLSTLSGAQHYVLVFWSTGCSHCLREIPQLNTFSKNIKKTKFIAFSLEEQATDWQQQIKALTGWHHVLGLNKWEHPIARTYQIYSTPTYIILDKNKRIIAKPNTIENTKKIIEYLEQ